jgi:hypothetical protein
MMYNLPSPLCRFAAMTFDEFLRGKKIDPSAFKVGEPSLWEEWSFLFEQMSVASFTAQKLYLINPTRRKYLLKEELVNQQLTGTTDTSKPATKKPVFKPKIN